MPCGSMPMLSGMGTMPLDPELRDNGASYNVNGESYIPQEFYSGSNVCDNQDDYNIAFHKAYKQYIKHELKKDRPVYYVYVVIWLIFFVWAVILAMKVGQGSDKILHLVFAMICSPLYVLAYYIGALQGGKMGFSF